MHCRSTGRALPRASLAALGGARAGVSAGERGGEAGEGQEQEGRQEAQEEGQEEEEEEEQQQQQQQQQQSVSAVRNKGQRETKSSASGGPNAVLRFQRFRVQGFKGLRALPGVGRSVRWGGPARSTESSCRLPCGRHVHQPISRPARQNKPRRQHRRNAAGTGK